MNEKDNFFTSLLQKKQSDKSCMWKDSPQLTGRESWHSQIRRRQATVGTVFNIPVTNFAKICYTARHIIQFSDNAQRAAASG